VKSFFLRTLDLGMVTFGQLAPRELCGATMERMQPRA